MVVQTSNQSDGAALNDLAHTPEGVKLGLPPWREHPFRLFSWLDMEKFSAKSFYLIIQRLTEMQSAAFYHTSDAFALVSQPAVDRIKIIMLPVVKAECQKIGLRYSIKEIDRILAEITSPKLTNRQLQVAMTSILNRICDELDGNLFLHVSPAHADYYTQSVPLFGDGVDNAFQSAAYDISEAGKCLALDAHTACVCHLMRVLEHGLRALAKRLHVPFDNKPWNSVIEVAEKRLRTIQQRKRKPKNWRVDEKFYSEVLAHFRLLKNAWRNYSMHVYEHYDDAIATSVFAHVKAFMQHLSTKLKE